MLQARKSSHNSHRRTKDDCNLPTHSLTSISKRDWTCLESQHNWLHCISCPHWLHPQITSRSKHHWLHTQIKGHTHRTFTPHRNTCTHTPHVNAQHVHTHTAYTHHTFTLTKETCPRGRFLSHLLLLSEIPTGRS